MIWAINDVPIHCINQAAIEYHLPASLIVAVLRLENGRMGQVNQNTDGSYDLGPMQINTCWLKTLRHYGYTQHDLQNNSCVNVKIGAWILAQEIANSSEFWQGIGNYHSHTQYYNFNYQGKIKSIYSRLIHKIETNL